jgi:hypothetical protein
LAAVVRKAPVALDTNELDAQARDEVKTLAQSVVTKQAATSRPSRPDEISYTLTIEDSGQTHEARSMETASSPEFSRLVRFVKENGRPVANN